MLKNLKIIELASVLAGPSTGMFFAELGAKVIKIENKTTGGDVTRKNKLLDKQKKGKKRMRQFGKVEIPQSAFINVLKTSSD